MCWAPTKRKTHVVKFRAHPVSLSFPSATSPHVPQTPTQIRACHAETKTTLNDGQFEHCAPPASRQPLAQRRFPLTVLQAVETLAGLARPTLSGRFSSSSRQETTGIDFRPWLCGSREDLDALWVPSFAFGLGNDFEASRIRFWSWSQVPNDYVAIPKLPASVPHMEALSSPPTVQPFPRRRTTTATCTGRRTSAQEPQTRGLGG